MATLAKDLTEKVNGPVSAALLAGGIGSAAMGLITLIYEINDKSAFAKSMTWNKGCRWSLRQIDVGDHHLLRLLGDPALRLERQGNRLRPHLLHRDRIAGGWSARHVPTCLGIVQVKNNIVQQQVTVIWLAR